MSNIREKYTFVSNKDRKWQGIGLTEKAGFYQGVVYEYGKVSIVENEEKTEASLQFDYNVLDSNSLDRKYFNDDFFQLLGDILQDLIDQQVNEENMQYVNTDD
jgi:hypothetical protein|tara:strand:- start:486 stop:794 length:309 start_codon:yes stop_codon:yes gene_type:complete